jgi:hypothetical protein
VVLSHRNQDATASARIRKKGETRFESLAQRFHDQSLINKLQVRLLNAHNRGFGGRHHVLHHTTFDRGIKPMDIPV